MLVFHNHAFHTRKWAADNNDGIASYEVGHLGLADENVFVARFYDDFETLHLTVGYGKEVVGAVGVGVKVIVIRCHPSKYRAELKKSAEVVQGRAEEQKSRVERLVGDILRGVVEVFVGVFYVAYNWEVRLKVAVTDGDELVINLLGAVMRGSDWKPVFFVWHKGNPNRLPEIDVLSFGICTDAFIGCCAFGRAAMELVQNRHLLLTKMITSQKNQQWKTPFLF